MQWLVAVLAKVGIDWLYAKVLVWGRLLIEYFKEKEKQQEIVREKEELAMTVEEISAQIKDLIKKGEPVPEELKEKLREAARKLINHSPT